MQRSMDGADAAVIWWRSGGDLSPLAAPFCKNPWENAKLDFGPTKYLVLRNLFTCLQVTGNRFSLSKTLGGLSARRIFYNAANDL